MLSLELSRGLASRELIKHAIFRVSDAAMAFDAPNAFCRVLGYVDRLWPKTHEPWVEYDSRH